MIRHARMRGHPTLFLPGLDHASIAAQFVLDGIIAKEGESRQSLGRERYLERMRAFVRLDQAGDARPAAAGRRLGRLGPAALHDGRGLGQGGPRRLRAALPRRPRLPHRGARQLVPGLPDERQRPRGRRRRPRPARSGRSATTSSTRRPASPSPRPRRSRSRRRGPETILGDTAVAVHPDDARYRGAGRPARAHPVRRARRADHRRRRRRPRVRDRRREDHAGPRPGRLRDRQAPRPADADGPRRRRDGREHRDRATTALDRYEARRVDRGATSRRAATSWTSSRTRWSSAAASAATTSLEPRLKTQWFIRTGPLAASGARGDAVGPDADPARAVREDLGALADRTSATGTCRASCGGATASRPGTARTGT